MGVLEQGKWLEQEYGTPRSGAAFMRQRSAFRGRIGTARFPAVAGRYQLYISHACPWAHRTAIFRKLKGLEQIIPITIVDALMGKQGWELSAASEPQRYLHELYTLAEPRYSGRVTVPLLWDKKEQTIVNNESAEIIRMLNSAFDAITGNTEDFYPVDLRAPIDALNAAVYEVVNNGVYKAGFATTQKLYEQAVMPLFAMLDRLEQRLDRQRYLLGSRVTEADWRLFTTLLRFDPVYVGHFKCNIRRLADYPNLSHYVRDLYQVEGVAETVDMQHIKTHYYGSHASINPTGIIPVGPALDYGAPHNRHRFL